MTSGFKRRAVARAGEALAFCRGRWRDLRGVRSRRDAIAAGVSLLAAVVAPLADREHDLDPRRRHVEAAPETMTPRDRVSLRELHGPADAR
jgi:hypothetical protein